MLCEIKLSHLQLYSHKQLHSMGRTKEPSRRCLQLQSIAASITGAAKGMDLSCQRSFSQHIFCLDH